MPASPSFRLPPLLLALIAGASSALTFAPLSWWPLQFISLAWLFHTLYTLPCQQHRRAFLLAGSYGLGWMLAGVYWLFTAMHSFGDMPAPLALLALILFALFLGLYFGLAAWLASRLRQNAPTSPRHAAVFLLLLLPACMALGEWLRGWLFTGFPWVISGYAHVNSPLAGFAPILGVYGTGWLALLGSGALALAWQLRKTSPPRHWLGAASILLLLLGVGAGLRSIAWTTPQGQTMKVRLLQGNISQDTKFARERVFDSLQFYQQQITQEAADLIATPETAFPIFAHLLPADYLPALQKYAHSSNSHLLLGVPIADGAERYTNSVLGISPNSGQNFYRYDKQHLVPFGEFIPPGFRWFVDMMRIPLGDFTPGPTWQAPFAVKDQWVLPNICYEDLFGEEIANQLAESATQGKPMASILLNVSNLAWYGQSSAIPQHLQIARMRALETGRSMLRATNTGATAAIAPNGELLALLPFDQSGILNLQVQGYTGSTPYIRWRNLPFLLLITAAIVAGYCYLRPSGR